MKKYPEYKALEIPWLKEIPKGWDVFRYKFLYRSAMGQTIISDQLITDGKYPVLSATISDEYFGRIDNPNFILKYGDLVIPARGNSIGNVTFVQEECVSTQTTIYSKLINKKKILPVFAHYFLLSHKSDLFAFTQTAIPQITVTEVKENLIVLPTIEEQTQIVKYLDYKTGLIDNFMASRKKQIDLLREQLHFKINEALTKGINENVNYKPTDIKYVPEIPEHWDIRKFKGLTNILTCGYASTPEYVEENEGVLFLSAQNVKPFKMIFDKKAFIKPELHKKLTKRKRPLKGDVLVTRIGGDSNIGDACIIDTDIEFSVYVSLTHICPTSEILSEYIVYFFNTEYCYQLNHEGTVVGGGQGNLNVKNVERYRIPLPPVDEQKEIVAYLDNYRAETDELISKYQKQIELMQEYRTAIISQAVTGKIDVREWQPKAKELQS
jgi:type I restriction enzyme S subunit